MLLAFSSGFVLRVLRRRVMWGPLISLDQAFAFEALFQGSILLCPQLPYPSTEREFLLKETSLSPRQVMPWFEVRPTSAVVIPLALAAVVTFIARVYAAGAVLVLTAVAVIAQASGTAARDGTPRARFAGASLLGVAAALAEGFAFVGAALLVRPETPAWQAFLLYAVLLTGFELSPVPLALGVLELLYIAVGAIPGLLLPGLILPVAYRAGRAGPVLLLTFFYLPRYKLTLRDIYDARLPLALALSHGSRGSRAGDDAQPGPLLSIVIPAYNEESRLPGYMPDVLWYADTVAGDGEVLVVDDGSTDGTAAYVESLAPAHPSLRLLKQGKNQGKGAAVRRGVMEARGRYVLFADADGATPIKEVDRLLAAAFSGIDVVIASRKRGGNVHRSWLRALMGAFFYRLTNLLAVPGIADTQCGFKLFSGPAARRLFPLVAEKGWAFDVEVLFLAQKLGLTIEEIPVHWTAVEGSKLHPLRDALKMVSALLRIRRRCAGLVRSIERNEAA
jgi:dolichyl-phosphate beta-glucosyltransferase